MTQGLSSAAPCNADLLLRIAQKFAVLPTLHSTASSVLQRAFHPSSVDPARLQLVEPKRRLPLALRLMQYTLTGEREDFVAQARIETMGGEAADVTVETVAQIIHRWEPLLLECHEQALIDFWVTAVDGQPSPWQWVSEVLGEQADVSVEAVDPDYLPPASELLALGVLDHWLQQLALIDPGAYADVPALEAAVAGINRLDGLFGRCADQSRLREELREQLPSWLTAASPPLRLDYSRMLVSLAREHRRSRGKTFLEGLPSFDDFALAQDETGDVDKAYESMLRRELAGVSDEAHERCKRLTATLFLHLRRLALEKCMQKQDGLTDEGCRWIRAAVRRYVPDRQVQGRPAVVRRLAMVLAPDATSHPVPGWFVLGPQDRQTGPQLLYRVGAESGLQQFSSIDELIRMIKTPSSLQAALVDAVGVVPEALSVVELADPRQTIYEDCVSSVLTHAAARRWTLFNPPGEPLQQRIAPQWQPVIELVARLKQVGGNLENLGQGTAPDTADDRIAVETSLLRNLALLLVIARPSAEYPAGQAEHSRVRRFAHLDAAWSSARGQFSSLQHRALERFKWPAASPAGRAVFHGAHRGLSEHGGALIANVDDDRFRVLDGNVVNVFLRPTINIIAPDRTLPLGPALRRDKRDVWQIDYAPRVKRDADGLSVNAGKAMQTGQKLLTDSDLQRSLARQMAEQPLARRPLPVTVQEQLETQARLRSDAAQKIARLTQSRDTQASRAMVAALNQQARELTLYGLALRIGMLKTGDKPSAGDLVFLQDQGVLGIRKLNGRLKGVHDGKADFLQEYEVFDRSDSHRPLWFAHFHYPAADTPLEQPSKAHLKTVAQRRLGQEYERVEHLAGRVAKVWRGDIASAQARRLFYALG